jgi:hypothetical protein
MLPKIDLTDIYRIFHLTQQNADFSQQPTELSTKLITTWDIKQISTNIKKME